MYIETIYHSTFVPSVNRKEMMRSIKEFENVISKANAGGCTMVCKDEVLHLLQGEVDAMHDLQRQIGVIFNDFGPNRITYEKTRLREFEDWKMFCDHESECLKLFGNRVISELEFRNVFIDGRKGVFSPFSHMADAILLRGSGVGASTADQLRPFL